MTNLFAPEDHPNVAKLRIGFWKTLDVLLHPIQYGVIYTPIALKGYYHLSIAKHFALSGIIMGGSIFIGVFVSAVIPFFNLAGLMGQVSVVLLMAELMGAIGCTLVHLGALLFR